nr:unnamed protein product [Spirometra erinaceieuropaei]
MDGQLLKDQRMHYQSLVSTTTVHELLFMDDCSLRVATEGYMQRTTVLFTAVCDNSGLIINTEKTVFMNQQLPNAADNAPQINFNGAQLQARGNFNYLDDTLSRSTKIDDEVAHQISQVSRTFVDLQNTIWYRHRLHLNTRLKMYKAVMLETLLYGAKTRTV